MYYRYFVSIILICTLSINSLAEPDERVFQPIDALFSAMSQIDHDKMRSVVTDSFVLLEHGEIWTIEDLIKVVSPSDFVRTNYFSIIDIEVINNIALVNYWNKANFDNKKVSEDVIWLESAVLKKADGIWILAQMHSTRLPSKESPKNVLFNKQKI